MWVVLFHIREIHLWTGGTAPYVAFISLGYLGVSFFFVLSGFILVYVYSGREIKKSRFWQARFARVYPAYAFSLLFTVQAVVASWPHMKQLHAIPLTLLAYPLLLEAWFPKIFFFWNVVGWSLSVELVFYLVFPYAVRILEKLTNTGVRVWMATAWISSILITGAYVLSRPDGVAHTSSLDFLFWLSVVKFNPLVRLPEFLLGMGIGTLFVRMPSRPRSWPIALAAALLGIAIVVRAAVPYPIMHSGLLAPVFALFIFGFATQPAWTRFLSAKPLLLMGEASYSLYLLHAAVIVNLAWVFHLADSPHIHSILVAFLVGINLFAIVVFRYIESPLRRLLRPGAKMRALSEEVPASEPSSEPVAAFIPAEASE